MPKTLELPNDGKWLSQEKFTCVQTDYELEDIKTGYRLRNVPTMAFISNDDKPQLWVTYDNRPYENGTYYQRIYKHYK